MFSLHISVLLLACVGLSQAYPQKNWDISDVHPLVTVGDNDRIVNGEETAKNEFPFMVRLSVTWGKMCCGVCGASLINSKWVLTAAHCLYDVEYGNATQVLVYLGEHDRSDWRDKNKVTQQGISYVVSGYNIKTNDRDFALIELDAPVTFSKVVSPICLSSNGATHVGLTATAIGWGRTATNDKTSQVLRKVQFPVQGDSVCERTYRHYYPDVMLCAGVTDGSKDTCTGDSGGPLFVSDGKGGNTLIGLTSYGGQNCAEPGYAAVYTKVSSFTRFIQTTAIDGGNICFE